MKKDPNFCENCAMDLVTCDCVVKRPVYVETATDPDCLAPTQGADGCKPGGCTAIGCEGGHYCFNADGTRKPAPDRDAVSKAIFHAMTDANPIATQGADARPVAITEAMAEVLGETGAPHSEAERKLYEAYCKGHCWAVGPWLADKGYYYEMADRIRFGMWRDRAALATRDAVLVPKGYALLPLEPTHAMWGEMPRMDWVRFEHCYKNMVAAGSAGDPVQRPTLPITTAEIMRVAREVFGAASANCHMDKAVEFANRLFAAKAFAAIEAGEKI